ncbi:MAG: hypothetical protein ACREFD_07320 [Stellaceae bacterium]
MNDPKFTPPIWHTPDGEAVSCLEKIKILNENLEEIRELAQDAFEDAVLMGCDEVQFRNTLGNIAQSIVNPYKRDKD